MNWLDSQLEQFHIELTRISHLLMRRDGRDPKWFSHHCALTVRFVLSLDAGRRAFDPLNRDLVRSVMSLPHEGRCWRLTMKVVSSDEWMNELQSTTWTAFDNDEVFAADGVHEGMQNEDEWRLRSLRRARRDELWPNRLLGGCQTILERYEENFDEWIDDSMTGRRRRFLKCVEVTKLCSRRHARRRRIKFLDDETVAVFWWRCDEISTAALIDEIVRWIGALFDCRSIWWHDKSIGHPAVAQ